MKKGTFCPGWSMWALAAPFVPVGVTNRDKRSSFVPVATPGTKGHPLLSRIGVPGWETGTTAVSQPGQINVFVVVNSTYLGCLGVGRGSLAWACWGEQISSTDPELELHGFLLTQAACSKPQQYLYASENFLLFFERDASDRELQPYYYIITMVMRM